MKICASTLQLLDEENRLKSEVNTIWSEIHRQCKDGHLEIPTSFDSDKATNVVRVFVSSTFSDFFNEREVLVKRVRITIFAVIVCC